MVYVMDLGYFSGLLSSFDLGGYVYKIYSGIGPKKIRICHF